MFKSLLRLISRDRSAPLASPVAASTFNSEVSDRLHFAVGELNDPTSLSAEKHMSDRAVHHLGENAFKFLPELHRLLAGSKWRVMWVNGDVRFQHTDRAFFRFDKLIELTEIAVAEAAKNPASEDFCSLYLTAVCSEISSINRQEGEMSGLDYDAHKARFLNTLQNCLGEDWCVKPSSGRHDFVLCYPERPSGENAKIATPAA